MRNTSKLRPSPCLDGGAAEFGRPAVAEAEVDEVVVEPPGDDGAPLPSDADGILGAIEEFDCNASCKDGSSECRYSQTLASHSYQCEVTTNSPFCPIGLR